jgi:hypothetical protein
MSRDRASLFRFVNTGAIVLVAALLSGCNGVPQVRSDTDKNFRKSVEEIARRLPRDKMEAFDLSLRSLVLSRAISSDAERHSHFVSFTDSVAGIRAFSSPLQDWATRRPSIVVSRIGRLIDGKTVDEIIDLAARERGALDARMQDWAVRQTQALETTWTMPESRLVHLGAADSVRMGKVRVSAVSVTRVPSDDGERKMLSFLVENLTDTSVRSITLANSANVRQRELDRDSIFHYVMPMPLAPGARRRIMTSLNLPADLSRDVTLIGMEDSAGNRTGVLLSQAPRSQPVSLHSAALADTPLQNLRTIAY